MSLWHGSGSPEIGHRGFDTNVEILGVQIASELMILLMAAMGLLSAGALALLLAEGWSSARSNGRCDRPDPVVATVWELPAKVRPVRVRIGSFPSRAPPTFLRHDERDTWPGVKTLW
jgi:hypothetical protein